MDFMWQLDARMSRFAWWRKWRGLPEPRPLSPVLMALVQEALAMAHEQPFLARVDASFARSGEGKTIRIRSPNRYTSQTSRDAEEQWTKTP